MWLKVKIVPNSWKWIRLWMSGPYWVHKHLFHQNWWYQKKPRAKFPRSRTQRPSTNFFFKSKISWKCEVFWKVGIITFQKSNICPNKLLETSELFRKIHFYSSSFQQISTLKPNLVIKFQKLRGEIQIV
jgi:hypothetical protein